MFKVANGVPRGARVDLMTSVEKKIHNLIREIETDYPAHVGLTNAQTSLGEAADHFATYIDEQLIQPEASDA